jgi:prevent-host-death family protein
MENMPVSKFKATCLAVLQRVNRTRKPIRITRYGKPVAEVVPPGPEPASPGWLGSMDGTVEVEGDIVGSILDEKAWAAFRR